jgi:hypothetical protein
MEKFKVCTIKSIFVIGLLFFFITVSIAAFHMQKSLLGITELEKRVITLEIEADQKAGLYKENE